MPTPPALSFVPAPFKLPAPPSSGRIVLIDLAFAADEDFIKSTRAFLAAAGERLAGWIDHHDHPAWPEFLPDPRFRLVSKLAARACPELVTPELVAALGEVHHVLAHADFDGCVAAAKFLRGGSAPYAEADEDARAEDAPGQGFVRSPRAERLCLALDHAGALERDRSLGLLHDIAMSLVTGVEPTALRDELDQRAAARRAHEAQLELEIERARRPHPQVLVLRFDRTLPGPDRKFLLRRLEGEATVAMLYERDWTTVATFRDEGPRALDLGSLPDMKGQRGYAWGRRSPEELLRPLAQMLDE